MLVFLLSLLLFTTTGNMEALAADRCAHQLAAADRPSSYPDPEGWGRYLQQIRRVLQCYEGSPDAPPPRLYVEKMQALWNLDRSEPALQTSELFLNRYSTTADSSQFRQVHYVRGWIYFYDGNLGGAAANFSDALTYAQAAPPPDRARLIANVAFFFQRVKDFDTAKQYYQKAKDVLRAVDPSMKRYPAAWGTIFTEEADFLLASTSYSAPDLNQIRQAARRADQALTTLSDTQSSTKVHAYTLIGEAHGMLENFERGRRAFRAALRLAEENDFSKWHYWALLKLGRLHLIANDLDAAEQVFTDALQRAQDAQDQDHIRRLHATFGLLHAKGGNPARAAASFQAANRIVEKQRATLRTTDWSASYFSVWSWTYRARARNLFLDGRYEEAFQALARMRARHLQDLQMQMHLTRTLQPAQQARYDSLTTALSDIRDRLANHTLSAPERTRLAQREMQLMATRSDLVPPDTAQTLLPLDTLQQQLRAHNQTLITYFIDKGSPIIRRPVQSFAFVVTPDSLHPIPLDGTRADYQALLAEVSPLLTDSMEAPTLNATHFDLGALHRLYQNLYAPIAPHVPSTARLVVIPDAPLFRLPMGMLVTEPVGRFAYDEASYLVERHPISHELSPMLLPDHSAPPSPTPTDLVAFGRSEFDGPPAEGWTGLRLRTATARPSAPAAPTPSAPAPLPDLPGVRAEFDRLEDLFARGRFLLDDRATETTFYADSNRAQIVHLASHALVQSQDPLQNAFALTPDAENDGLLYLHELMTHHRSIPLVVLSACGTAQGAFYDGEGMRGMQYAFRATGAQSTLSTLWSLDDEAAITLTASFYRHLREDTPKDVALQRAQLNYLRTHDSDLSPFYWAGPVLYGSPQPLALATPASLPVLPAAAGLALLLLGGSFAYARYRRTRPHD